MFFEDSPIFQTICGMSVKAVHRDHIFVLHGTPSHGHDLRLCDGVEPGKATRNSAVGPEERPLTEWPTSATLAGQVLL